jgi:hypothetical protein
VVVSVVRPGSATVHERRIKHHTRLRRSLQLLGASPFPSLQIWLPNLGVQVYTASTRMYILLCVCTYLVLLDILAIVYAGIESLCCLNAWR